MKIMRILYKNLFKEKKLWIESKEKEMRKMKNLSTILACMCANEKWEKEIKMEDGGKEGFLNKTKVFRKILICYLRRQVMCCFNSGVAEQAGGSTLR